MQQQAARTRIDTTPPAPRSGRVLQRKCACGTHTSAEECESCAGKRGQIQRKVAGGGALQRHVPSIVASVLDSPGQSLDPATRGFMEDRFGHDFGKVQVHTDAKAAQSAYAINALAYASGQHVVIPGSRYDPRSPAGRGLLAHELAHVVQQRGAVGTPNEIAPSDGAAEREADAAAEKATRGESADIVTSSAPAAVARLAVPPVTVTPAETEAMRALFQEVMTLARSGAIAAEESALISTAVGEAEAAIVVATEMAAAGATATVAGEAAVTTAVVLAADDITGIGIANDVAIPFVLLAAAIGFGVGFAIGYSVPEIATAWEAASRAVANALRVMREAVRRAPRAPPDLEPESEREPRRERDRRPRRQRRTGPDVGPVPEEGDDNNCFRVNPSAQICDEPPPNREDILERFGAGEDNTGFRFGPGDIGDCYQMGGDIPEGEIDDCGLAPAKSFHCRINGAPRELSIFQCLCCDQTGTARWQWSRPHWSPGNLSRRGG